MPTEIVEFWRTLPATIRDISPAVKAKILKKHKTREGAVKSIDTFLLSWIAPFKAEVKLEAKEAEDAAQKAAEEKTRRKLKEAKEAVAKYEAELGEGDG